MFQTAIAALITHIPRDTQADENGCRAPSPSGEGMPWVLLLHDPGMKRWLPKPAEEAEAPIATLETELEWLRDESA